MPDTLGHTNGDIMPLSKRLKTEEAKTNGYTEKEQDGTNGAGRKNQFGDVSDGHMSLSDWVTQWDKGRTKFHKPIVHPMLKKHVDRLVEGKDKPRFFLPLCGKSVDLKWLLDMGYSVVGCEIAEVGIQQFFKEHDIEYKTEQLTDIKGTVYKGTDRDISIFACDFFQLTSAIIGEIDCIWDRGSMAAINPDDRQRYAEVIMGVLKSDGRYLLDVFQVEHHSFAGPPHNFEVEEAQTLFGTKCNVEHIEHVDAMSPWQKTWGTAYFFENDFLITPKNN